MKNSLKSLKKLKLKGYSIIELIISMGIIAIATGALLSSLIYGFRLNVNAIARSFVREEVASVASLIVKDIRNSDRLILCSGEFNMGEVLNDYGRCRFVSNGKIYDWAICDETTSVPSLCKYSLDSNFNVTNIEYKASSNILVQKLIFESTLNTNLKDGNILVTIVGAHANANLEIFNIFSQLSASTRNFEI